MAQDVQGSAAQGPLIYRQSLWTRATHWVWVICLFFLMLTGLQIFNAHPSLHIGPESGFEYDNAILQIGARQASDGVAGFTRIFGQQTRIWKQVNEGAVQKNAVEK